MPRGYISSQTCVHFMHYHFVWCPKYRRPVLVGVVRNRLEGLVKEKVEQLGCKVIALTVGAG
jgi:putative transposase